MSRDVRRAKSKPRYCYRCDVMCTAHDSSCLQDFGHEAAGKVQKGCSDGKTQNVLRCATNTCFFFDSQTRQCHKVCTLGGSRTAHLFHELVDCMCRSFMPFKSWAKTCAQAIR